MRRASSVPAARRHRPRPGAPPRGAATRPRHTQRRPGLPPRRKAYRLGKFLGDVNTLRKTRLHAPFGALEWVAAGGECVYYFTDQLVW